jgi:hypothetical protein
MLLIDIVACYLVVFPVYAFQVSSSSTGYVRVATSAAMSAYQAANLPTQAASLAGALAGSSAGASMALRVVAGSSFVGLGLLAGLTLWEVYYNAQKTDAIKAAAAPAGPWTVAGVTGSFSTVFTDGIFEYVVFGDASVPNGCSATTATQFQNAGYAVTLTNGALPVTSGHMCTAYKGKTAPGLPVQGAATPATGAQIQAYLQGLPAGDPLSIPSNTVPLGSGASPTPATTVQTVPVSSTEVATTVKPAAQVGPTDVVVDPNATPPAGPAPTAPTTQVTNNTSTTTTTTITNQDGSTTTTTTQTQTDDVPAGSCGIGNHEPRSFGGILQTHMETWKGSGLVSALTLLGTLVWPSTSPTYTLTSTFLGSFTFDFTAWSGVLLAIRSVIIAIAGFVAYKIIFVGGRA